MKESCHGSFDGEIHYGSVAKITFPKGGIEFYQVLHQDQSSFLFKQDQGFLLLRSDGEVVHHGSACALGKKIVAYERIMGKDMIVHRIDYFLRIDEVAYILTEFLRPEDPLYQINYPRLRQELDRQIELNRSQPLDLFSIAHHYEFIYDSLVLNLGLPERSENYYHKLNRTINRLLETLEYIVSDEDPQQTLIKLLSNLLQYLASSPHSIVAIRGYAEHLIIKNNVHSGITGFIVTQQDLDGLQRDLLIIDLTKDLIKHIAESTNRHQPQIPE